MPAPLPHTELSPASRPVALAGRLSRWLQAQWWQAKPGVAARLLQPLSWVYLGLARWHRHRQRSSEPRTALLAVPVVVVGNLIVGGAGKTPATMALVQHLRSQGWRPGIVSRGYGRRGSELLMVNAQTPAAACGDEPLLMHLRTQAPVAVARHRLMAAQALLAAHPEVDIIVSDDGLQHWPLPRDLEVLVFDGRGAGNGLPLPAGPLREPMPRATAPNQLVLYNANSASTGLPGALARRALGGAVPLVDWWQGQAASHQQLSRLAQASTGKALLAAAGTADPERFFTMLEQAGCHIQRWPLPDHASLSPPPWPTDAGDVLVTEKDAVKLLPGSVGATHIWVVTLDFHLPLEFTAALDKLLPQPGPTSP
jgi:tetraacyldisaccharide 4'-kinase